MKDLIYRQDAIDALEEVDWYHQNKNKDMVLGANPPEHQAWYKEDDIYKTLETLPSAQPEQRWIPVSERLPEEKDAGILKKLGTNKRSDYVIATVEVKGERMTATACTYDGAWDWNMKYAFPDFKVVAWMPLPEPYKERREE